MGHAPQTDYHHFIQGVQEQEARILELEQENRLLAHRADEQEALATKRLMRIKALHSLSLGMLKDVEAGELHRIACEIAAQGLGWDAVLIVNISGGRLTVSASSGASDKQLDHIRDTSVKNIVLTDLAAEKKSYSTIHSTEKTAFALRVLFNAEEVVVLPIIHDTEFFGYLAGCVMAPRTSLPTIEDGEFLAVLASYIGQAQYQQNAVTNLKEQNLKLKELDELKDSFISITSHQLRTPLSIIKWILSILQADQGIAAMPEQHKLIEQAYISNERLIHVVNDLLNASRIHEGTLPYTPQDTDVREILVDVCESAQKIAAARKITVTAELPEKIPTLSLDPIIFKSALQNLTDNATDYNVDGGWIKVRAGLEESQIKIVISNSGPGIPEDEQKKIFAQFYRSPDAVQMRPNGNGLGLYITEAIVRRHGGTISCESRDGETSFTIVMPLVVSKS